MVEVLAKVAIASWYNGGASDNASTHLVKASRVSDLDLVWVSVSLSSCPSSSSSSVEDSSEEGGWFLVRLSNAKFAGTFPSW
jgi:hypothetical protein